MLIIIKYKLETIIQNMKYLTKQSVLYSIKKCVKNSNNDIHIYYTGHGQKGTGNWCFDNGVVTLDDIIKNTKSVNKSIYIYADCCYSGQWAVELHKYQGKCRNVYIETASRPGEVAWDTKDGGMFTLVKSDNGKYQDFAKLSGCQGRLDKDGSYTMKCIHNIYHPFILIAGSSSPSPSISKSDKYEKKVIMEMEYQWI